MKPNPAETPTAILAGLVERMTFHNEDNGFAVLRVKTRGKRDLITFVGHAAVISAGELIQRNLLHNRGHARRASRYPALSEEGHRHGGQEHGGRRRWSKLREWLAR